MSSAGRVAAGSALSVGFGRVSLWGTWKTEKRLADEIEVRVMAVRGDASGPPAGRAVAAAIAVADFGLLWPATCARLRHKVGAALGIPPACVGIFTTQNHGVDGDGPGERDHDGIDHAFVAAARQAADRVAPARVAPLAVHPHPPLNYCRRIPFADLGALTFWFGFRLANEGRADVSHLLKLALAKLAEGKAYQLRHFDVAGKGPGDYLVPDGPVPLPEPVCLPPAADDLLQALFFRRPDGTPVGSLLRFAAHPVTANRAGADWHSGDYPVYVRRRLEQAFGGTAVFMTGPCGDLAPPVDRKSVELARSVGERVADAALAALPASAWEDGGPVRVASPEVRLRIRPDYPASREAARDLAAELEARIRDAAAEGRSIAEIKRLSDRWELAFYVAHGHHYAWTGLDLTGRAGQDLAHPLFLLRMGRTLIAGLPGEPFGAISSRLRAGSRGDSLIVCEEANGYLSYIPTAEQFPLGAYGPNAALFDGTAEDSLVEAVIGALPAISA